MEYVEYILNTLKEEILQEIHLEKELPLGERASQVAPVVKNLPGNAGNTINMGSIPGSGRSLEEERATHSSILAWRIPRTEEPDGLQSMGSQRAGHD